VSAPPLRRHREVAVLMIHGVRGKETAEAHYVIGGEAHGYAEGFPWVEEQRIAQAIANAEFNERVRCFALTLREANDFEALHAIVFEDCGVASDEGTDALEDISLRYADGDHPDDMPTDDDIRALVLLGWRDEEVTK
jgi:hypothetical protein